jgi:hypothetical protein
MTTSSRGRFQYGEIDGGKRPGDDLAGFPDEAIGGIHPVQILKFPI